jgi:hypothetical protein
LCGMQTSLWRLSQPFSVRDLSPFDCLACAASTHTEPARHQRSIRLSPVLEDLLLPCGREWPPTQSLHHIRVFDRSGVC